VRAARKVIDELERSWANKVGNKRFAALLEDITALHVVLAEPDESGD
jgi:hypothetical protein